MTVRLAMIQQMADQYKGMMAGWNGWLVIRTIHHHLADLHVPPGGDVALTEMGVLINWPGDHPDGMFLPWTEVISMEQEHESAATAAAEAREARANATSESEDEQGTGNGSGRVRRPAARAGTA